MKTSERIETFMGLIREVPTRYKIAQEEEVRSDKETQDILHWHENFGWDTTDAELVKAGRALSLVRRRRRRAKNTRSILHPVAEWASKNENVQKNLERLLGDVRKAEKGTEKRYYMDRTDIVKEILGTSDEEDEG